MEMPGIEPGAFHMQSERSTTEPHPQREAVISAPGLKKNRGNNLRHSVGVVNT